MRAGAAPAARPASGARTSSSNATPAIAQGRHGRPPIESVSVSVYTIPTDAPEGSIRVATMEAPI